MQLLFPGGHLSHSDESKPVDQIAAINLSRGGTGAAWHLKLSSSELAYFFHLVNDNVVHGFLPLTMDSATSLAALQAQVEWGEYDPAEEVDTDTHKLT